jgi:pantoate kinase
MAKTPEAKVKDQIKKVLDDLHAYYTMPIGVGFGNSGVPDFLVCIQGRFVAIEAKAGSNKPTALQMYHMTQIRAAGGRAYVINEDNIKQLKEMIKNA